MSTFLMQLFLNVPWLSLTQLCDLGKVPSRPLASVIPPVRDEKSMVQRVRGTEQGKSHKGKEAEERGGDRTRSVCGSGKGGREKQGGCLGQVHHREPAEPRQGRKGTEAIGRGMETGGRRSWKRTASRWVTADQTEWTEEWRPRGRKLEEGRVEGQVPWGDPGKRCRGASV